MTEILELVLEPVRRALFFWIVWNTVCVLVLPWGHLLFSSLTVALFWGWWSAQAEILDGLHPYAY